MKTKEIKKKKIVCMKQKNIIVLKQQIETTNKTETENK